MSEPPIDAAVEGSPDSERTSDSSGNNIPLWERAGAGALGGALLILGLRRRSPGGAALALAGGWLSYRALRGRSRLDRALDANTAGRGRRGARGSADSTSVRRSITVGRPPADVSASLRDPETLDRIAGDAVDVTPAGDDRHRWVVHGPLGRRLSGETRIVEDRPGELIRWESVDGAALSGEGSASFRPAPGDRGTVVTLVVRFDPLGGSAGIAALERLEVVPDALVGTALDRFKSLVETGEVQTLERNPSGRGRGDLI